VNLMAAVVVHRCFIEFILSVGNYCGCKLRISEQCC
jgi:hypothetical protein